MSDLANQARPAVDALLREDEEQLYVELGSRLEAIRRNPALGGSFSPEILETLGPLDDIRAFGQRFFERINTQTYALICGEDPEQGEDRKALQEAFVQGRDSVAAAVAGLLIAQLAIAPAIAPVIAAIVVKLFFRNAHEAMCAVWKEKQQTEQPPQPEPQPGG